MAPRLWAPSPPPPFRLRHPHLLPPSPVHPRAALARSLGRQSGALPFFARQSRIGCCAAMLRSSFLPSSFQHLTSVPPPPPPFGPTVSRLASRVKPPLRVAHSRSARCQGDHGEHVAVMDTMKKATMGRALLLVCSLWLTLVSTCPMSMATRCLNTPMFTL